MSFSILAALIAAALLTGGWSGYHFTAMHFEHVMEKQAQERRAAEDQANLLANKAALRYEETKMAQVARVVVVTKEINRALETDVPWRDQPLPRGVFDAIAAASAAVDPAKPDGAVQLPVAGSPDERSIGDRLRFGAAKLGGLPSSAPRPR